MKKWGVVIVVVLALGALYFIEFSKVQTQNETSDALPTLDALTFDESTQGWEHFYKVRAKIIDGQHAEFSIPKKLKTAVGKSMQLTGAAVFFGTGVQSSGDSVTVYTLFLYPTLGLANACEHLPEIAMRWTIRIHLKEPWKVHRTEMIDARVKVRGTFRIDTSKPYESAFFLDNATIAMANQEKEVNP